MADYYPLSFKLNGQAFYCIYVWDDVDRVLTEDGKILFFRKYKDMLTYCKGSQIGVKKGIQTYQLDYLKNIISENSWCIDCEQILAFWNIAEDIAKSVGMIFYGQERNEKIDKVYDKLFWGNNASPVTPEGRHYTPLWDDGELLEIKKVLEDGMRILNDSFVFDK